ncbi:MAG TPA: DUF5995 family protein [Thermoanaerobaculia bacterium]|jgi:hypothetical protein
MQANGIDDVLRILDGIIADTKAKSDPLGYFPALYRQVTLTVKQGIATGYFDDGPRMDRFDALFASRSKDVPAIIDALNAIVPATGAVLP